MEKPTRLIIPVLLCIVLLLSPMIFTLSLNNIKTPAPGPPGPHPQPPAPPGPPPGGPPIGPAPGPVASGKIPCVTSRTMQLLYMGFNITYETIIKKINYRCSVIPVPFCYIHAHKIMFVIMVKRGSMIIASELLTLRNVRVLINTLPGPMGISVILLRGVETYHLRAVTLTGKIRLTRGPIRIHVATLLDFHNKRSYIARYIHAMIINIVRERYPLYRLFENKPIRGNMITVNREVTYIGILKLLGIPNTLITRIIRTHRGLTRERWKIQGKMYLRGPTPTQIILNMTSTINNIITEIHYILTQRKPPSPPPPGPPPIPPGPPTPPIPPPGPGPRPQALQKTRNTTIAYYITTILLEACQRSIIILTPPQQAVIILKQAITRQTTTPQPTRNMINQMVRGVGFEPTQAYASGS